MFDLKDFPIQLLEGHYYFSALILAWGIVIKLEQLPEKTRERVGNILIPIIIIYMFITILYVLYSNLSFS